MKGFILAGGEGTRLRPLTLEIPKPLLTVRRIPVINYLVDLYLDHGINDIRINIQRKHMEDFYKWKATYYPHRKIEFLIEEEPSGTFAPLVRVEDDWFSEPIVVTNGDELKEFDVSEVFSWHLNRNAIATIGLVEVEDPRHYGVAITEGDLIVDFIEKPQNPPSNYINSGFYVLSPEIKKYYPKGANFAMLELDLFPKLAAERKLHGYKLKGRWMDIGTFERWEKAIMIWHHERITR